MQRMIFEDLTHKPFKVGDRDILLIELFGGIGSQAMALRNISANFTTYKLVEFEKYCIKSYNAIHNTEFEPLDITKIKGKDLEIVDVDKHCYIMTYSFPCQDLSLAGKGKGMRKGDNTRSGLLWEVERLLTECEELSRSNERYGLPSVLLMENVPQVHGKKNIEDFQKWLDFLKSLGYENYYQDLNAKDYGVAQNRNRCFCVSLLGNYTYQFPSPKPLDKSIEDYLEEEVDEKYFVSGERSDKLCQQLIDDNHILENL